jgi:hypothetical protein
MGKLAREQCGVKCAESNVRIATTLGVVGPPAPTPLVGMDWHRCANATFRASRFRRIALARKKACGK